MLPITPTAWVAGISAYILFATGWIAGISSLVRYFKKNARLLVWAGIMLILMGNFYLGTVVSFSTLLITGHTITPGVLGGQLCFSHSPIAVAVSVYLGFTLINRPKLAKITPFIFLATAPFYWWGLWFNPNTTISAIIPGGAGSGNLDHYALQSYVGVLTAIYLLCFLIIVAGAFYWMSTKSTGVVKRRFIELGLGFTGFVIAGAIDSLAYLGIWIFIPRIFMVVSYLLLYFGFTRVD